MIKGSFSEKDFKKFKLCAVLLNIYIQNGIKKFLNMSAKFFDKEIIEQVKLLNFVEEQK
jgi:hypothetical protein